jgi:hypothetical protein
MSAHLSERALVHVQAGLGEADARRHVDSCLTCARRLQALTRDLSVITRTLGEAEPRPRPVPVFRRWIPAAAAATGMALAALLWMEVAVWRAVTYVPPTMKAEEARAMLAQVSAALFSLRGDATAAAEASTEAAEALVSDDEEQAPECTGPEWLMGSGCGAGAS